ncbi:MAG: hypothetical protein FJZ12_03425, partial [Candidatus Omnitrophica bacterium]|nr:hypothetical protein [Candidatus Omnitrophota bacterium]
MSKNIFGLASSYLIELSVISLIIFSPLIYAGVTILPLSVIEAVSFLAVAILLIKAFISGKSLLALGKVYIFPFLIFILLGILHLIRFPFSTLLALSPGTVSLYSQFGTGTFKDIPLSIYPDATVSILLQALAFFSV